MNRWGVEDNVDHIAHIQCRGIAYELFEQVSFAYKIWVAEEHEIGFCLLECNIPSGCERKYVEISDEIILVAPPSADIGYGLRVFWIGAKIDNQDLGAWRIIFSDSVKPIRDPGIGAVKSDAKYHGDVVATNCIKYGLEAAVKFCALNQ